MRIDKHPVLEEFEKGEVVEFTFDGKNMFGYEGEPIVAALQASGVKVHRHTTKTGEPRGVFCAIGRCTDCVMVVNGKPNVRTCVTPLEKGMQIETQYGIGTKE